MCLYSVHPFLTVNWPWKEENIGEIRYVFHFGANLHSRQTFQGFLDILDSMTNISVIFMVSLVRRVFHLLHGFFGQLNGLAEFGRLGF